MQISFSKILTSFRILWQEFSVYKTLIILLLIFMWFKIALESILPLLLIPLFGEVGGNMMDAAASDQLQYIYDWIIYIQHCFGFNSVLETTFYLAMVIVIPKAVLTILYQYLQNHIVYSYENDKRNRLFSHLLGVNWTFYLHQNSGKIINTLHSETNRAAQVFTGLISLIDAVVLIGFYLLIAAYVSWVATLFALGAFVILVGIIIPAAKRAKLYGEEAVVARETLMHHLHQLIHSFKVLKGSRMETAAQKFIADASARCRFFYIRTGIIKILPGAVFEPVIIISLFGLVYAANVYSFISIAEAGVVAVIMYRCFNKSANLHKFWIGFYEYLPSLRLMQSLPDLYLKNKENRPSGTIARVHDLVFDHVSFQYPTGKVPAIHDINLHIHQGDYIGIVGASGSGKTTLVDTLLYLLKPTGGKIVVNHSDLHEIDPWQWRELIGYVPQESVMLHDTVKNNIALYRPNITQEDIQWAAGIAHANEFIDDLPDGLETVVGERGSRLSGGQRQRLALARALVNKPQILLLDEATSALDTFTEKKIQEAVDELKGQFTILVIAHRLSTVLNADRIIVLEHGRIVQNGTPDELIAHQGEFQKMYQQQFHGAGEFVMDAVPNSA